MMENGTPCMNAFMQVFRASLDFDYEPVCVFEEPDERYNVSIRKSADKKLIWIDTGASMQNEVLYVSSAAPSEPFKVRQ
jgi:protease II